MAADVSQHFDPASKSQEPLLPRGSGYFPHLTSPLPHRKPHPISQLVYIYQDTTPCDCLPASLDISQETTPCDCLPASLSISQDTTPCPQLAYLSPRIVDTTPCPHLAYLSHRIPHPVPS